MSYFNHNFTVTYEKKTGFLQDFFRLLLFKNCLTLIIIIIFITMIENEILKKKNVPPKNASRYHIFCLLLSPNMNIKIFKNTWIKREHNKMFKCSQFCYFSEKIRLTVWKTWKNCCKYAISTKVKWLTILTSFLLCLLKFFEK